MLYAFYFITIFFLAFSLLFKNDKRLSLIVTIIAFVFMFVSLGWASGAYDVEIGISRYVNYTRYQSFTEIGFQALIEIGHRLGFSYRVFYVVLSFFELVVIYWFIRKNVNNINLVLLLFMLYPMVMFFQYTRNILAFSFVLIGINQLIHRSRWFGFKFILFILIASSIHISSLFFIFYLPAIFVKKKWLILFVSVCFIVLFFAASSKIINDVLLLIVGDEKMKIVSGTTGYSGMFGRIAALTVTIVEFWAVYLLFKFYFRINTGDTFSTFVFAINCLSFLFIPLTLKIGSGFNRIPTLLTLINYCYVVEKCSLIKSQTHRFSIYAILMLFMLVLFIANFRNEEMVESVLKPFFEGNDLFK